MTPATPQLPLALGLVGPATLAGFVAGDNGTAVQWLQRTASAPAAMQAFLAGGRDSGKSHLLQAVCRAADEHGHAAVYAPLGLFGDQAAALLDGLESAALVCIDDVDAIAGDSGAERALFDLYNRVHDARGGLVLSGSRPPALLPLELPDLVSRLAWGACFQLRPLDDPGKLQVLQQRATTLGFELPAEAGDYLLQRSARGLSDLLRLLDRVDRATLAAQRRVTVPFLRGLLNAAGGG
ncbi:MAG TPA: DnaA regulatory inactivator Hda [Gammaproteobacteria bacterium]